MTLRNQHRLWLVGISAAIYFVLLGSARLWDVDEAIFAQCAAEMQERGDWVVPYFNGAVFPDKPPLVYWTMMGAYSILGKTELAARIGSALFGIGTVLLTYGIGRRLFGAQVALWGSVVLASALNFAVIARAATPDAALTFACTLALWCFVRGTALWMPDDADESYSPLPDDQDIRPSLLTWLCVYAAMGLAVLAKGPVGVVLPTTAIGLFLLLSRTGKSSTTWSASLRDTFRPGAIAKTIFAMQPWLAVLAVLAVAGPWYALVGFQTQGSWLQSFFGTQNLGRFLNPMDNHRGPIFYYLLAVLVGMFPWSSFAVETVRQSAHRIFARHPWRNGVLLMLAWAAVWIGFFSLASTKLPNYIIPAYPALSLLVGGFLASVANSAPGLSRKWLLASLATLGLVGLITVVATPIFARVYLGSDGLLGLFGFAPLVGAIGGLYFLAQQESRKAVAVVACSACAMSLLFFGFTLPRVDRYQHSQELIAAIHEQGGEQACVGQFDFFRPSLVFYHQHPIQRLGNTDQITQFFAQHPRDGFLVTSDEQLLGLTDLLPSGVVVLDRRPIFGKQKDMILLGRTTTPAIQAKTNPPSRTR